MTKTKLKRQGFLKRMSTTRGMRILNNRRRKGRAQLIKK